MSVKDVALPLAQAEADAKRAAKLAAIEAQRDKDTARQRTAAETLERSPLGDWFPHATFDILDYTGVGTSMQYQSDGNEIIVCSDDDVLFGVGVDRKGDVKVHVVTLVHPTGYYASDGPYYSGPEVNSPLEVGRWLLGQPK